jgi:hypothetical protein
MRGGEDAVADEGAIVEEADIGQELDGRLAILVHDPLELDGVAARMRVHGHVQLARGVLAGTQQGLAARLDLRRVQHAAQASLRRAVVGTDEGHRVLQSLRAESGVVVVVKPPLAVVEGIAVAEGRAPVHAHTQLVDQAHVALPVPALAAHVDDGGRALLEGVEKDEGAERRCGLRRRRRHLALQRRGEAHVVGGAVVVLRHVEQEVVAAVAGSVHVSIDESGRDEFALRRQARVDRARVRAPGVHDPVVLEDDAPLLVHFMTLAVERHYPAAFDERFHDGIDSNRHPPCQDGLPRRGEMGGRIIG